MLGRARVAHSPPGGLVLPFVELGVAPRPAGELAVEGGLVAAAAARVDGGQFHERAEERRQGAAGAGDDVLGCVAPRAG